MHDSTRALAGRLDHSMLKPTMPLEFLDRGCALARASGTASVCVLPFYVPRAVELLAGSKVAVGTVVGFPLGANSVETKLGEARGALDAGASEIDAVVNVNAVLSAGWAYVTQEVQVLCSAVHAKGGKLKLILETCYLDTPQKIRLTELASELGVDWVKTSTGYGPSGATREDILLLLQHKGPGVEVKASGGIDTLERAEEFIALGATRIGTSHTEALLRASRAR